MKPDEHAVIKHPLYMIILSFLMCLYIWQQLLVILKVMHYLLFLFIYRPLCTGVILFPAAPYLMHGFFQSKL